MLDHAHRAGGIGGSDAAAALGVSPWVTPFALWLEKVGRVETAVRDSLRLRAGTYLEAFVRDEYQRKTGVEVLPGVSAAEHPAYHWMRANTDGTLPDGRVWECKTVEADHHRSWGDRVPLHYQIQVQHYCSVLAAPGAVLCALVGYSDLRIYEIPRHDAFIDRRLVPGEADFWRRVTEHDPPRPTGTDAEWQALSLALEETREPEPDPVDLDDLARDLAMGYRQVSERVTELERERKELRSVLFGALLDSNRGYFPDGSSIERRRHGKGWRLVIREAGE